MQNTTEEKKAQNAKNTKFTKFIIQTIRNNEREKTQLNTDNI